MVHIKIDEEIISKVKKIVKEKQPHRKIKTDTGVIKEALFIFISENESLLG